MSTRPTLLPVRSDPDRCRSAVARPTSVRRIGAVPFVVAVALAVAVATVGIWPAPSGAAGVSGLARAGGGAATVAAAAIDNTLPPPQVPPATARDTADSILARPEYQPPAPTIWDRIGSWIGELLARLLSRLFSGPSVGAGGPWAWIILAVLVGIVILLLTRLSIGAGATKSHDPLFATELEAVRSPVEWLSEAERFEGRGAWKQALRCRYRALVSQLIDRGVLVDIPGRTSGEFRIEVFRRAPHAAADFGRATDLFDSAWYGDKPTGQADNARFQDLSRQVLDATKRRDDPLAVPVGAGAPE
jgi:hypothetical protein